MIAFTLTHSLRHYHDSACRDLVEKENPSQKEGKDEPRRGRQDWAVANILETPLKGTLKDGRKDESTLKNSPVPTVSLVHFC